MDFRFDFHFTILKFSKLAQAMGLHWYWLDAPTAIKFLEQSSKTEFSFAGKEI